MPDPVTFIVQGQKPYHILELQNIKTPRLLVFLDRVRNNISRMKTYLESVAPDTGYHHLCTHVKTHKSAKIASLQIAAGIEFYKTSLNETALMAEAGAKDIFIAYPLLHQDGMKLVKLIIKYPQTTFHVQAGSVTHFQILNDIARQEKVLWNTFIDVDVGMHRTGIAPQKAFDLFKLISESSYFKFTGLHGYDGHNHLADAGERETLAQEAMGILADVFNTFQKNQITVPRIMVAGTPTFHIDFEILYPQIGQETHLQVSPGTWIYWDSVSDQLQPRKFEMAALILAQVIEVSEEHRITLNLGHKRLGPDRGPVELFSHPDMQVTSFNEEHTVLKHSPDVKFQIGDYILIAPKHVCSTVNLYEYVTLIGEKGKIEQLESPVDARNR